MYNLYSDLTQREVNELPFKGVNIPFLKYKKDTYFRARVNEVVIVVAGFKDRELEKLKMQLKMNITI